jgi:hypothetical protein
MNFESLAIIGTFAVVASVKTRTSSLGAARPLPPRADVGPGGQSVGQLRKEKPKKAQLARETGIFLTGSARLGSPEIPAYEANPDDSQSGQKMRHRLLALHQMVRLRICYDRQQAELLASNALMIYPEYVLIPDYLKVSVGMKAPSLRFPKNS